MKQANHPRIRVEHVDSDEHAGVPGFYCSGIRRPALQPDYNGFLVLLNPVADPEELFAFARRYGLRHTPEIEFHLPPFHYFFSSSQSGPLPALSELMRLFRDSGLCRHVLLPVADEEGRVRFLQNRVTAALLKPLHHPSVQRLLARLGMKAIGTGVASSVCFEYADVPGEAFLRNCDLLVRSGIATALHHPSFGFQPLPLQSHDTNDFLGWEQWHLEIIGARQAWYRLNQLSADLTLGSPHLIIGVVDFGVPTELVPVLNTGGVQETYADGTPKFAPVSIHPAFRGTVSNGADKVVLYFDPRRSQWAHISPGQAGQPPAGEPGALTVYNHNAVGLPYRDKHRYHGLAVSSLCLEQGNDEYGGAGVAGNARLLAVIAPAYGEQQPDLLRWVFGVERDFAFREAAPGIFENVPTPEQVWNQSAWFNLQGMPAHLGDKSASVSVHSYTWEEPPDATLPVGTQSSLNDVVIFGRNGRGGLIFIATGDRSHAQGGDKDYIDEDQPIALEDEVISVNSTSLEKEGSVQREVRWSGNSIGRSSDQTKPKGYAIDICAPAHTADSAGQLRQDPPDNWGIISAAWPESGPLPEAGTIQQEGVLPGGATPSGTLFREVVDRIIKVEGSNINSFYAGGLIYGGDPVNKQGAVIRYVLSKGILFLENPPPAAWGINDVIRHVSGRFTTLRQAPAVEGGVSTIIVVGNDVAEVDTDIKVDQYILIGPPDDPTSDVAKVTANNPDPAAPADTTRRKLTLDRVLAHAHAAGDEVRLIGGDWTSEGAYKGTDNNVVRVDDASGFVAEQKILVGNPGANHVVTVGRTYLRRYIRLTAAPPVPPDPTAWGGGNLSARHLRRNYKSGCRANRFRYDGTGK